MRLERLLHRRRPLPASRLPQDADAAAERARRFGSATAGRVLDGSACAAHRGRSHLFRRPSGCDDAAGELRRPLLCIVPGAARQAQPSQRREARTADVQAGGGRAGGGHSERARQPDGRGQSSDPGGRAAAPAWRACAVQRHGAGVPRHPRAGAVEGDGLRRRGRRVAATPRHAPRSASPPSLAAAGGARRLLEGGRPEHAARGGRQRRRDRDLRPVQADRHAADGRGRLAPRSVPGGANGCTAPSSSRAFPLGASTLAPARPPARPLARRPAG